MRGVRILLIYEYKMLVNYLLSFFKFDPKSTFSSPEKFVGSTATFLMAFSVGNILNLDTISDTVTFVSKNANLIAKQVLGPNLNATKLYVFLFARFCLEKLSGFHFSELIYISPDKRKFQRHSALLALLF